MQDNSQLIRNFYQSLEKNDPSQALSYFASNAEFKVIGMDQPFRGQQEIGQAIKEWNQTFPDLKSELVNVISSGDSVVVEFIARGTHKGPMESPTGTIAPTQRKIEVPACDVFKLSGGKILSWNCYWQSDVMMQQLGIAQVKAAA
ncbi:MAG: nuclear transport factor 2 family protein [Oligoflexia bacterium]|nr:nuclear transport factor 2 family protein [Oligoflexia bacterium]